MLEKHLEPLGENLQYGIQISALAQRQVCVKARSAVDKSGIDCQCSKALLDLGFLKPRFFAIGAAVDGDRILYSKHFLQR